MNTTQTHHSTPTNGTSDHIGPDERSMTAIVQTRYGSADTLELRDISRPTIGDHDVLVQITTARGGIVTGVATSDKLDLVRRLGASQVIDYRTDDPLAEPLPIAVDTRGPQ